MATSPPRDQYAYLRSLEGEAKRSFPWQTTDWPVTERVERVLRRDAVKPLRTTVEPDTDRFPHNRLVFQKEIGGDRTHAEMYRRYERLPSPPLADTYVDDDTGQVMADIVWEDWNSSPRPARGGNINVTLPDANGNLVTHTGFIVLNSRRRSLGLLKAQFSVKAMRLPLRCVERIRKGYTFPAIMKIFANRLVVDLGTRTPMPWLGYNYTYLPPRQGEWKGFRVTTYSKGPSSATLPEVFSVLSPAANSRIFPLINEFTIHNAFDYYEIGNGGIVYYVERFPASNPTAYQPGQLICVRAVDEKWIGPLWRQTVEYIRETPLSIFGLNWQFPSTNQTLALASGEPNSTI